MRQIEDKVISLSPQQEVICDFVSTGRGSAFVEAVAGAGKTTTLIEALKRTTGYVAFAAYNAKIAAEIKAKIAKSGHDFGNRVKVGTFHSFGLNAWRFIHKGVQYGPEAAKEKARLTVEELQIPRDLQSFVEKLVSLAKQRALGLHGHIDDVSEWYDIIEHFDLAYEIEDEGKVAVAVELAIKALKFHRQIAASIIDFDDMIYMPVVTGCRMLGNDFVFVDEAQDTNPARRALARKMLKPSGRAIFVGDRHQAIYGFTGADADAIEQIVRQFNCKLLPLTITYRCPKAVVRAAQEFVSHIEAADEAPEGVVRHAGGIDIAKEGLTATDAILCRNTAPLVEMAYSLIAQRIACHVEGKDIGHGLLKLVNQFQARNILDLKDAMEDYRDKRVAKLVAKGKEQQAESLSDRIATLMIIANRHTSVDAMRQEIASMFTDSENEPRPTLTLCTAHRSKGREWDRVFILGRHEYMPSKYARQAWQMEQELNLLYVAFTRAVKELVIA